MLSKLREARRVLAAVEVVAGVSVMKIFSFMKVVN
jgi:hypothetical protein